MQLDDDEIALVERHRAEKKKRADRDAFVLLTLKVAAGYEEWLQREQQSDSFSTFVNQYGYQCAEASKLHDAIKVIRAAAYSE